MRTVNEIISELASIRTDSTVSDALWQQAFKQLTLELEAAKMAAPFNYDAAIELTRQDEAEAWRDCACGCGDGNEYDRQWGVDLHALARYSTLIYAYSIALPFVLLFAAIAR